MFGNWTSLTGELLAKVSRLIYFSKTEHALILRIEKMSAETATYLSCVDEEGSQLDYRVRLLEPPKVQVSLNSAAELVQGDLLKVKPFFISDS